MLASRKFISKNNMSVRAKKHLGQHFLTDENIAKKIADSLTEKGYDEVLEIGPGMGVLTKYLLTKKPKVTLMELDSESVIYLKEVFPLEHIQLNTTSTKFQIIEGDFLKKEIANLVEQKYGKPDVIAGVATGAIAIGVLIAQELGVPFVYVRPEPKKHGRKNQIEGFLDANQNVVVIEDLISTGKSSLNAVKALKEEGANVKGMIAIFSYGFAIASENFEKEQIELTTLSNYSYLIEQALESNYVTEEESKLLEEWRLSPSTWKQ